MVVPLDTFAGKNLMEIEIENFEAVTQERKQSKAKFFPTPAPVAASVAKAVAPAVETEADKPSNEGELVVVKHANDANEDTSAAQPTEITPAGVATPQTADGEAANETTRLESDGAEPASETQPILSNTRNEPGSSEGLMHVGVICIVCGVRPITGVRWKCLVCNDYDLCNMCHSSGASSDKHLVGHRTLRMETPSGACSPAGEKRRIPNVFCRCYPVAPEYSLRRVQKRPNSWYPLEVYGVQ